MHRPYKRLIRHTENDSLFHAVELSVLAATSPTPLHLHAEGLRGTGKTSILRAARDIMPQITRVKGCIYNCDPEKPHCPMHRNMSTQELSDVGHEAIPMPYLEISHSAKIATVVGSIDLAKLTDRSGPEAAMLPGILARAHRGIVLVDEINRLADTSPEIADVLLDVMGTKPGRLQIEETGLPTVELPLRVTVWAASNPDEDPGPLDGIRRQLSDRFDLCVGVKRPNDVSSLSRVLALSSDAYGLSLEITAPEQRLSPLWEAAKIVGLVQMSQDVVEIVSRLYIDYSLESIRAAESILYAARMNCARRGALRAEQEDIVTGAELALRHRVSPETLADILTHLKQKPTLVNANSPSMLSEIKRERELESSKQGGLLTRLFDAFKEPRTEQIHPNNGQLGGPHIADYNPPSLHKRRNVHAPAGEEQNNAEPQELQMVAPRSIAKSLNEIPYNDRVRSEGELQ